MFIWIYFTIISDLDNFINRPITFKCWANFFLFFLQKLLIFNVLWRGTRENGKRRHYKVWILRNNYIIIQKHALKFNVKSQKKKTKKLLQHDLRMREKKTYLHCRVIKWMKIEKSCFPLVGRIETETQKEKWNNMNPTNEEINRRNKNRWKNKNMEKQKKEVEFHFWPNTRIPILKRKRPHLAVKEDGVIGSCKYWWVSKTTNQKKDQRKETRWEKPTSQITETSTGEGKWQINLSKVERSSVRCNRDRHPHCKAEENQTENGNRIS